jgi:hypothetical protein
MKSTQELKEHLQQQVRALESSGMTRRHYCEQKQIKIYQLDYWRKKLGKLNPTVQASTKGWISLRISDEQTVQEASGICLRIGRLAIEVKPGFDRELLTEVLRVVSPVC